MPQVVACHRAPSVGPPGPGRAMANWRRWAGARALAACCLALLALLCTAR